MHIPRLLVSALRGGAGKTLLSLGLARAFCAQGLQVKPFKKGPDYIDAAWLGRAAHCPCTNLDPFFLTPARLRSLFHHAWTQVSDAQTSSPSASGSSGSTGSTGSSGSTDSLANSTAHIALLEGNRGLFDGRDVQGSCSSAELARVLETPVLLSLDCTKMTRTAAAVVAGLAAFEPGVRIGGVVLNQVASARHENIVRQSIEAYTDILVLGAMPRLKHNPLPERHMGLVMQEEGLDSAASEGVLEQLGTFIAEHTDLPRILDLARSAPPMPQAAPFWPSPTSTITSQSSPRPRIGFVRDAALWFYYHENLESLERAGAELISLSLLDRQPWPALDGLYLGGGFPEEYAAQLSASPHLETIRALSALGAPIYAECGGFMLLAESIVRDGIAHPMTGIFPVSAHFQPRPQGLGYVEATVTAANPFHPLGAKLRGHEFHYSRACAATNLSPYATLHLHTGTGMGKHLPSPSTSLSLASSASLDGLCVRHTFAAYTHIFAPAVPWWAENFVATAQMNTSPF